MSSIQEINNNAQAQRLLWVSFFLYLNRFPGPTWPPLSAGVVASGCTSSEVGGENGVIISVRPRATQQGYLATSCPWAPSGRQPASSFCPAHRAVMLQRSLQGDRGRCLLRWWDAMGAGTNVEMGWSERMKAFYMRENEQISIWTEGGSRNGFVKPGFMFFRNRSLL